MSPAPVNPIDEILEAKRAWESKKASLRNQVLRCPDGGYHKWVYSAGRYDCPCGASISKADLKATTD